MTSEQLVRPVPPAGDSEPLVEVPTPAAITPGAAAGIELQELAARATSAGLVGVTCIDYCPAQVRSEEVTDLAAFIHRHRPSWSQVRWINVAGLTDMSVIRQLAEKYELHPLAVEDVLGDQRPKLENYPECESQLP